MDMSRYIHKEIQRSAYTRILNEVDTLRSAIFGTIHTTLNIDMWGVVAHEVHQTTRDRTWYGAGEHVYDTLVGPQNKWSIR